MFVIFGTIYYTIGENQYLSKDVIDFSELYITIYVNIFTLYCVAFHTLYIINEIKADKDRSKADTSKADTSKADTEKNIPILISIEGNIGTGKSTLIERYKLEYSKYIKPEVKICFISEPIDIWNSVSDENGVNILEKFYDNQHKYAFSFQMMAYISRLSVLKKALKQNYDIIIMERSLFTDYAVFAKMLYDDKIIELIEYTIYLKWFNEFIEDIPKIFNIYIKVDPTIAANRVIKRNRLGENIPLSYLETCHMYHEKWLLSVNSNNILILDGNVDRDDHLYIEWYEEISYFINNHSKKRILNC